MKKLLQIGVLVFIFLVFNQVGYSNSNFFLHQDSTNLHSSNILSLPDCSKKYSFNRKQSPFLFKHFNMNQAAELSSYRLPILFHMIRPAMFSINSLNPVQPSKSINRSQLQKHKSVANQVSEPLESRLDSFVSMGVPLFVFGIFSVLALVLFGRIIYYLIKAVISKIKTKKNEPLT